VVELSLAADIAVLVDGSSAWITVRPAARRSRANQW
jgi:hypothetical protein